MAPLDEAIAALEANIDDLVAGVHTPTGIYTARLLMGDDAHDRNTPPPPPPPRPTPVP